MSGKRSDSVEEMTDEFLTCRDKGHHWTRLNDKITGTVGKRITEVSRWWQCRTCSTEMQEVFEIPSCEIKTRRYTYPDGYLYARGEGENLRVRDVRRQVFSRNGIRF